MKKLNFPAGDTIEMLVCRDSGSENENIPFQLVELNVKRYPFTLSTTFMCSDILLLLYIKFVKLL